MICKDCLFGVHEVPTSDGCICPCHGTNTYHPLSVSDRSKALAMAVAGTMACFAITGLTIWLTIS